LEINGHLYGEQNSRTMTAILMLSVIKYNQGKYSEYEQLTRRLYKATLARYGEEGEFTILAVYNLGDASRILGRPAEAEALFAKVAEIRRRKLGPENIGYLNAG